MSMDDYNTIHVLYKLASENEKSKEYVAGLVYDKIHKLKKELYDITEFLKRYEMLEKDIKEMRFE